MSTLRRLFFILVAMLLALPLWAVEGITFVQTTDPQFGMGTKGYQEDKATFERAVAQINALKPKFVLVCGDLLQKWTTVSAEEFLTSASAFTMPWYVAAGNHDEWRTPEYARIFGPDHRVVELPTVKATLLIVNTNVWQKGTAAESDAQFTWFEGALQEATVKGQTILVAGHHPIFVKAADEKDDYNNLPLERRTRVLTLFDRYHVAVYLSGHLHKNIVAQYHGTAMVSNGSTAKNFTVDPLGFRIWHLDATGYLTQEYVPVSPSKTAEVETKSQ